MFISLFSFFFIFFLFIIKSLISTFFKKELKKYIIVTYECNKNEFFKQQFFFNLIKVKCVHMHTNSFNLKEFNIVSWQLISLCWLKTHVTIQHINNDECLKIVLKIKMSSSLMIINLWIIIDNALYTLKELIKWRDWRLMMVKKLSMMLWCFKSERVLFTNSEI